MSGIPNHSLHSLITSTDTVRKIFIRTLFIVNSNDLSCVLLIGQASSAYNKFFRRRFTCCRALHTNSIVVAMDVHWRTTRAWVQPGNVVLVNDFRRARRTVSTFYWPSCNLASQNTSKCSNFLSSRKLRWNAKDVELFFFERGRCSRRDIGYCVEWEFGFRAFLQRRWRGSGRYSM